jgi:flagellar biosynthesis/type III secretory pathway chaperone
MEKQELATLLKKLQAELESGQAIDDSLKQSLQALDQDIQKVLGQASLQAKPADEASLNERAQELEAKFAAEHPYLASTLRDVMDTLGKMGI